jgi:hypothetical protein
MMDNQEIKNAIDILMMHNSHIADCDLKSKIAFAMAISALEQKLTGGWVQITERWPEKSGHYLVTYREWTDGNYLPKYDDTRVKILRYQEAIFRMPVCCDEKAEADTHREVIAWQPLPKPYKEVDLSE